MVRAEPVPGTAAVDEPEVLDVLQHGDLAVTARFLDASNVTLLGTVTLDGVELRCVYKPVRGERPLWDFPDGTLAERERAAYLLSRIAGWDCVPATVLRDGPVGPGMVQVWVETPQTRADAGLEPGAEPVPDLVDLFVPDELPDGWLPVLRAVDADDREIVLAHADLPALAVLAAFDAVTVNADRKGSHILALPDGRIQGIDHGLCLHAQDKLRTVLWGFAGRRFAEPVLDGLRRVSGALQDPQHPLTDLLTVTEIRSLTTRVENMLTRPTYPPPPRQRTPIPWPAL